MAGSTKSWSNLPAEIKTEVLKILDFQSSHRLRFCSRADLEVVDSIKFHIPFLKIGISQDIFSILILQSVSEILRIDIKVEENSEIRIYRSQNLDCENSGKLLDGDFQNEISNLLNGMFRNQLEIDSCLIENENIEKNHTILQFIQEKIHESCPKKLILSGKSHSETLASLDSLKKSTEILVRNWTTDDSRIWEDWKHMGFKAYEVSNWRTKTGTKEHITAFIGIGLVSHIARIESNPQKRTYWIPGSHVEDPEHCLRVFRGSYEEYTTYSIYKIPIDAKKSIFVKFSKCGILIRVGEMKTVDLNDTSCGLGWMCPNCSPDTIENWFFRETIGHLH